MTKTLHTAIAPLVLSAALLAGPAMAQTPPVMSVTLTPGPMNVAKGTGWIDVTLVIPAAQVAAGGPLLTLPVVIANTDTIATTLTGLAATDVKGAIPLSVKDDPVGLVYARHWLAGRAVSGNVTVRYRAPVDDTPPSRGSGPPYSLRTEGGGVSGVGNTFILLPEGRKPYRIALRWDVGALGKGATATSSYGEGDVDLEPGPAERLASTVFMAGPMHRQPVKVSNNGFSSAWLGAPSFDPKPLMTFAETLHGWMSGFFKDPAEPPYRVFLRFNPINAGGGTALTRSFLVTYGKTTTAESLEGTLSHEMTHTWTRSNAGQYYGEGIAVHYEALLPLRAGLFTPEQYLADINDTARRYYSNALNDTPNDQIAARFWEDTRIRVLPYDRGALYLDILDGKIRRASGGKRSLDDLVWEMNRRLAAGERTTDAVWLSMVVKELGEDGRALHASMLAGGLMLPEPGDFGPCFTRVTARSRRFDLGFEPKSLVGDVKTIRGLKPDSEAAKAGLRDGDVVTYAVAMDGVQSNQTQLLTLQVTRDGKSFPLTYLPRGETVDIYQWARVAGVPDKACVI